MTLRTGHGAGAGVPRVEVLPADELPAGLPAPARTESPAERPANGRFAPGNTISREGGKAKAGRSKLGQRLSVTHLDPDLPFAPYQREADAFRAAHCAELAQTVGGGRCGSGPSSIVASAALQLAWSRYLFDLAAKSGDAELATQASKLANDHRQNLLAAHEKCAREALGRAGRQPEKALLSAIDEASKG